MLAAQAMAAKAVLNATHVQQEEAPLGQGPPRLLQRST